MLNSSLFVSGSGFGRTSALLASVDLCRETDSEPATHVHPVRVVEHVVALVFDEGTIVSTVVGRSLHCGGHLLCTDVADERTTLSPSERADVLAAAGVRPCISLAERGGAQC